MRKGVVSDSFVLAVPFSSYLIDLSSLDVMVYAWYIVACYAMFGWCSWKACSFLRECGCGVDLGNKGDWGSGETEERRERKL